MPHTDEDDRVWEQLKGAHQDAGPADPRWEALTLGTLTAEEAEALRVEDPDKYERFRPFTEDEQDRIFSRAQARLTEPDEATVSRP